MVSRIILCIIISNAHGLMLTDTFLGAAKYNHYSSKYNKPISKSNTQVDLSTGSSDVTPGFDSNEKFVIGTAALSGVQNPLDLLDAGYTRGFNRFDIARTYGGGRSEEIIGEWIHERQIDPTTLNIVTKGGMGEDKYGDPHRTILTRDKLREEMHTSLKTLGLPNVNLYMYHRDDPRIAVSDMVLWMNEFISEQKTHRWGVSNWSFERFQEATYYALENGLVPPAANSPQFSLARPACEIWPTTYSISDIENKQHELKWYAKNNIELICWEVLAKGMMAVPNLWDEGSVTFKNEHEYEVGTDEWRMFRIQRAYCNKENYRRRKVACDIAEKNGLTLAQIALLYPLSYSFFDNDNYNNISVIAGVDRVQHFDDMAMLRNLKLTSKERSMLLGTDNKKEKTLNHSKQALPSETFHAPPNVAFPQPALVYPS